MPPRLHYRLTVDKKQNFILPKLSSVTSFIREPLGERQSAKIIKNADADRKKYFLTPPPKMLGVRAVLKRGNYIR
jgi:hypothetical protein